MTLKEKIAFALLATALIAPFVIRATASEPKHVCFAEAFMSHLDDGREYKIKRCGDGVWQSNVVGSQFEISCSCSTVIR